MRTNPMPGIPRRHHRRLATPRAPGEVGAKNTLGHLLGVRGYAETALVGQSSGVCEDAAVVRQRGLSAKNKGVFGRKPHPPHPCLTLLSISNPLILLFQVREVRKVR